MYHFLPGAKTLSFGMLGCNFKCSFCQNWFSSQVCRDPDAVSDIQPVSAEQIKRVAVEQKVKVVVSTYNEPVITSEWAHEIFELCGKHGMMSGFVSNGYASEETLDFMRPVMDFYKADLKTFDDNKYRELGGELKKVMDSITYAVKKGYWVEVVTLVVPGFNDSEAELKNMAEFIKSVSRDIPWHVTAFHPDYRENGIGRTPVSTLERSAGIGHAAGLRYVYAGNIEGDLQELENTYCPSCGLLLIERHGFTVGEKALKPDGSCPKCSFRIAGIWT